MNNNPKVCEVCACPISIGRVCDACFAKSQQPARGGEPIKRLSDIWIRPRHTDDADLANDDGGGTFSVDMVTRKPQPYMPIIGSKPKPPTAKVLMLDWDGVMKRVGYDEIIDQKAGELLQRIIKETGAIIVLTSNRRVLHAQFVECLRALFKLGLEVETSTPVLPTTRTQRGTYVYDAPPRRGDEIQKWIDNCHYTMTHLAIVDDNRIGLEDGDWSHPLDKHLFLTSPILSERTAQKIIDRLNGPSNYKK